MRPGTGQEGTAVVVVSAVRSAGTVPAVQWQDVHDGASRLGMVTQVAGRLVAVCAYPCLARIQAPFGADETTAARMLCQHAGTAGHAPSGVWA